MSTARVSSAAVSLLAGALGGAGLAQAQWTVVNLHPAGATSSFAYATDAGQQGGFARINGDLRAALWSGSAASWVDLHPAGFSSSPRPAAGQGCTLKEKIIGTGRHAGASAGVSLCGETLFSRPGERGVAQN